MPRMLDRIPNLKFVKIKTSNPLSGGNVFKNYSNLKQVEKFHLKQMLFYVQSPLIIIFKDQK